MKLKETLCESGGKQNANKRYINEDFLLNFAVKSGSKKYNFIILMDGSTGLGKECEIMPGYTSAEWYVKTISLYIRQMLTKFPCASFEKVVDNSIEKINKKIEKYETEKNIKLEEYQKPSASISLLRSDENQTVLYLMGDTQTLIKYKNGKVEKVNNPNQVAVQKLDNLVLKRMVEISREKNCDVIDARKELEIEKMLQENRNKKNTYNEGGYWVCGTTIDSAKNGVTLTFNNSEIAEILLATDGFDYSMLGVDDDEIFKLVNRNGIEKIKNLIREKQNKDLGCNVFPRFKKGDDLTVAYLEYIDC